MSEVGAFVGIFSKNLHLWLNLAVGKVRQELHKLLTGDILTTMMEIVCNKNGENISDQPVSGFCFSSRNRKA